MTILHTVASTHPDAGGTSRTVKTTCEHLAARDICVELVTQRPPGEPALAPEHEQSTTTYTNETPLDFRRTLSRQIESRKPVLVHDNGIWLAPNLVSAIETRRHGLPHVVTTHGMLEPWAFRHRSWKKTLAWYGYQRWILQHASLIHATAEMEADHLRELGLTAPIAVIPNGVPLPQKWKQEASDGPKRQALFLSRIHPKKGLPMLLDAWAEVRPTNWRLLVVGPNENNHRKDLEAQAQDLGLSDAVTFQGPVSDEHKWSFYRESDLFVLPTHSENFGVVVAEALASGLPVLTTTGAPWAVLEDQNCGWWVDPKTHALKQALRDATDTSDAERLAMGQRGRALVEERFSWAEVARQLQRAYRWVVDGGTPPHFIQQSN